MSLEEAGRDLGGGGYGDYRIANLDKLEENAGNLANYSNELTNHANSIEYIMRSIKENWENEDGQDIQAILTNLESAIKTLTLDIQPVLSKYFDILNNIVYETRETQGRTLQ